MFILLALRELHPFKVRLNVFSFVLMIVFNMGTPSVAEAGGAIRHATNKTKKEAYTAQQVAEKILTASDTEPALRAWLGEARALYAVAMKSPIKDSSVDAARAAAKAALDKATEKVARLETASRAAITARTTASTVPVPTGGGASAVPSPPVSAPASMAAPAPLPAPLAPVAAAPEPPATPMVADTVPAPPPIAVIPATAPAAGTPPLPSIRDILGGLDTLAAALRARLPEEDTRARHMHPSTDGGGGGAASSDDMATSSVHPMKQAQTQGMALADHLIAWATAQAAAEGTIMDPEAEHHLRMTGLRAHDTPWEVVQERLTGLRASDLFRDLDSILRDADDAAGGMPKFKGAWGGAIARAAPAAKTTEGSALANGLVATAGASASPAAATPAPASTTVAAGVAMDTDPAPADAVPPGPTGGRHTPPIEDSHDPGGV